MIDVMAAEAEAIKAEVIEAQATEVEVTEAEAIEAEVKAAEATEAEVTENLVDLKILQKDLITTLIKNHIDQIISKANPAKASLKENLMQWHSIIKTG